MAPMCSRCRADTVGISIPNELREYTPVDTPQASLCRVCLTLHPLDEPPASDETLTTISEAFPADESAAAGIAVALGLLESLALHRRDLQAVVDHLETGGVDALLVLHRLADDPDLRPAIDLDRRVYQLEQLLE